jgi:hypothetical protein
MVIKRFYSLCSVWNSFFQSDTLELDYICSDFLANSAYFKCWYVYIIHMMTELGFPGYLYESVIYFHRFLDVFLVIIYEFILFAFLQHSFLSEFGMLVWSCRHVTFSNYYVCLLKKELKRSANSMEQICSWETIFSFWRSLAFCGTQTYYCAHYSLHVSLS